MTLWEWALVGLVAGYASTFCTGRRRSRLVAVLDSLQALNEKVDRILMNEKDLQAAFDEIKTRVGNVAASQAAQAETIAALQAQLAAGTPVSQEQLDALTAEANEIKDQLAPFAPAG